MARIFITGSADGLGLLAAQRLAKDSHKVTLHARDEVRAAHAKKQLPEAEHVLVGDVSTLAAMRSVAAQANATGPYDAIIHNVAVGYQESKRIETVDGTERVFAVNALAPYVLTALVSPPSRAIYLSSGLHKSGDPELRDPQWTSRRWNGTQAYSDSKLYNVLLAFAVARKYPAVLSNAMEPGWVPTKMGGAHAPDDLSLGSLTQAWLAVSDDANAKVSGKYFYHQMQRDPHRAANDTRVQDEFVAYCAKISGIALPS